MLRGGLGIFDGVGGLTGCYADGEGFAWLSVGGVGALRRAIWSLRLPTPAGKERLPGTPAAASLRPSAIRWGLRPGVMPQETRSESVELPVLGSLEVMCATLMKAAFGQARISAAET